MKHIAILDDDPYIANQLGDFFELEGWTFIKFTAVDQFEKKWSDIPNYSVLILDIMMMRAPSEGDDGSMDTGELLYRRIREKFPKLPIIVLTAKDLDSININFHSGTKLLGIQKPVDESAIERILEFIHNS